MANTEEVPSEKNVVHVDECVKISEYRPEEKTKSLESLVGLQSVIIDENTSLQRYSERSSAPLTGNDNLVPDLVEESLECSDSQVCPLDPDCINSDYQSGIHLRNLRKRRQAQENAEKVYKSVNDSLKELTKEHNYIGNDNLVPDLAEESLECSDTQVRPLDPDGINSDFQSGIHVRTNRKRRIATENAGKVYQSVNESSQELTEEHNWRNKNIPSKRARYTKACPNFDSSNIEKYTSLPLLPNGNLRKSVMIKPHTFIVKNTCGFDSVCQIVAMVVCNNPTYRESVVGQTGIYTCIDILIKKGLVAKVFTERANLLRTCPKLRQEVYGNAITVYGDSSITQMIEQLFANVPSRTIRRTCPTCKIETVDRRVFLDVNYNPLTSVGIKALDQAVAFGRYDPPQCCGLLGVQGIEYGPHLFVDVDTGRGTNAALCDVPRNLTVNATQYKLAGVIEYQGPNLVDSLGHYIAYCWTGSPWLKYNDGARK